jgi:GDPmannose 4,6-dehydratase
MRPAEVDELKGDASKAKARLGWQPTKSFNDIIKEMVENDISLISNDLN